MVVVDAGIEHGDGIARAAIKVGLLRRLETDERIVVRAVRMGRSDRYGSTDHVAERGDDGWREAVFQQIDQQRPIGAA